MAMRRACGFEAGSVDVFDSNGGAAISNVQVRSGSYSCYLGVGDWATFSTKVDNVSDWYIQAAFWVNGSLVLSSHRLLTVYDRFGTVQCYIIINVPTYTLSLYKGDGALQGTSVLPINTGEWFVLEAKLFISADSEAILKVNGVTYLTVPHANLLNGAIAEINTIMIGRSPFGFDASVNGFVDDFVANDTAGLYNNSWPNQLGLYPVVPEGVGTTTQLTPTAGVNWDNVEEVPPNDGDYVYSNTVDQFDTYEATDIAVAGLVRGVIKWGRAREDVAAPRNFAHMWRIDGTDYTGSDIAIDVSFDCYDEIDEVSPDTGVPFTIGEINAAEIGVKVR